MYVWALLLGAILVQAVITEHHRVGGLKNKHLLLILMEAGKFKINFQLISTFITISLCSCLLNMVEEKVANRSSFILSSTFAHVVISTGTV